MVNSGYNLQGDGLYQELQLLSSHETSRAWNEGGGKVVRKKAL